MRQNSVREIISQNWSSDKGGGMLCTGEECLPSSCFLPSCSLCSAWWGS